MTQFGKDQRLRLQRYNCIVLTDSSEFAAGIASFRVSMGNKYSCFDSALDKRIEKDVAIRLLNITIQQFYGIRRTNSQICRYCCFCLFPLYRMQRQWSYPVAGFISCFCRCKFPCCQRRKHVRYLSACPGIYCNTGCTQGSVCIGTAVS